MPERVTRAQAEAALDEAQRVLLITANTARADGCDHEADRAIAANAGLGRTRAYLAQRPDEETVRKGHEALAVGESISELLRAHTDPRTEFHKTQEEALVRFDRIRAAMYQPEEEAMGTNYYHTPDPCPTCGHGEERHIGKKAWPVYPAWAYALAAWAALAWAVLA